MRLGAEVQAWLPELAVLGSLMQAPVLGSKTQRLRIRAAEPSGRLALLTCGREGTSEASECGFRVVSPRLSGMA